MIKIPSTPPFPQFPVPPDKAGKKEEQRVQQPAQRAEGGKQQAMPLDSHGIAVRLAALAIEAKDRDVSMAEIIEKAMELTGMTNPEAAIEEVNIRLQKEIEAVLDEIKGNKELMEEAEAWQALGDLLESNLSKDQLEAFIEIVQAQIRTIK